MEKKLLLSFFDICRQARNAARLLKGAPNAMGHRMFPSKVAKHDERLGYRVDQVQRWDFRSSCAEEWSTARESYSENDRKSSRGQGRGCC